MSDLQPTMNNLPQNQQNVYAQINSSTPLITKIFLIITFFTIIVITVLITYIVIQNNTRSKTPNTALKPNSQKLTKDGSSEIPAISLIPSPLTDQPENSNQTIYIDEKLGFSFYHPPDWYVKNNMLFSYDAGSYLGDKPLPKTYVKCDITPIVQDMNFVTIAQKEIIQQSSPRIERWNITYGNLSNQPNDKDVPYVFTQSGKPDIYFICFFDHNVFQKTIEEIALSFKFKNNNQSNSFIQYNNPNIPIIFQYPADATLIEENTIQVSKMFKKTPDGKLEDGYIVSFQIPFPLENIPLLNYVSSQLQSSIDASATVIQPISPYSLNKMNGYSYAVEVGQPKVKINEIFLPSHLESDLFTEVQIIINDPQNKGYEKTAYKILESLTFLK